MGAVQSWRVVLEDGTAREVLAADHVHGDSVAWFPEKPKRRKGAASMRVAVTRVATENDWPVAEVLAPGERSQAELATENSALLYAAREYVRCTASSCSSCDGRGMVPAGYATEEACDECVARENLATLAGCYE